MSDIFFKINKYIEAINKILNIYSICNEFIIGVDAFKPLGDIDNVEPSVLSALMTFGLTQNKSLQDISLILDDINNNLIPYIKLTIPDYDFKEIYSITDKLLLFKQSLENACKNQHSLSCFNYDGLSEDEISKIFENMAIMIKNSQESIFKLMAISVTYHDFFEDENISFMFIFKKKVTNSLNKSYHLMFTMCNFLKKIETFRFLSEISSFYEERNSYKTHYSGQIIIPKKD
jgi:hypothetical protein